MSTRKSKKRTQGFPLPMPGNRSKLARALRVQADRLIFCDEGEPLRFSTPLTIATEAINEGPFMAVLGKVTAKQGGCKVARSIFDRGVAVIVGDAEASDVQFAAKMHTRESPWGNLINTVDRLYVWPGCDIARLAAFLVAMKLQIEASTDYSIGLIDIAAARKWVEKEFGITANDEEDCIFVDGCPVYLEALECSGFPGIDEYVSRHGKRFYNPYLRPRHRSYLAAIEDCQKACRHILRYYQVIAYSQGEKQLMKFGYKGETNLTPFNSFCIEPNQPMHCLQTLLLKHYDLWEMLWDAATERREMVSAYPRFREIRLSGDFWEGQRYPTSPFERLGKVGTLVPFDMPDTELRSVLSCLSGKESGKIPMVPPRCLGVLADGNLAFSDDKMILVPINPGEMKSVILHLGYGGETRRSSSVWGVSLARTPESLAVMPLEAGTGYRCTREEVFHR